MAQPIAGQRGGMHGEGERGTEGIQGVWGASYTFQLSTNQTKTSTVSQLERKTKTNKQSHEFLFAQLELKLKVSNELSKIFFNFSSVGHHLDSLQRRERDPHVP